MESISGRGKSTPSEKHIDKKRDRKASKMFVYP